MDQERDADEIIGLKPQPSKATDADIALAFGTEEKLALPSAEDMQAFADKVCDVDAPNELPIKPMPENPEQVAVPPAVLAQMQQMMELQQLQQQNMLAMKQQLELERSERKKLEETVATQNQQKLDGQVHYQMPANLSEEQQWNLALNDPNGLLG